MDAMVHVVSTNPGILHAILLVLITHEARALTSRWRLISKEHVMAYESMTSANSNIDCVQQCSKRSPFCVRAAYDGSTGKCYLLPDTVMSTADVPGSLGRAKVFENVDPICAVTDPQATVAHSDITAWHRTLTSLTGDVACQEDYLAADGEGNMGVRCLQSGQWETTGECVQHIWRQGTVSTHTAYPLPHPLSVGQSLCVTATPTQDNWFGINLLRDTTETRILHMSVRFSWKGSLITLLDARINGAYGYARTLSAPDNPFPFQVGHQAQIYFTAISVDQLRVYVDGSEYFVWTTPLSVDNINHVEFQSDVNVDMMDLACSQ